MVVLRKEAGGTVHIQGHHALADLVIAPFPHLLFGQSSCPTCGLRSWKPQKKSMDLKPLDFFRVFITSTGQRSGLAQLLHLLLLPELRWDCGPGGEFGNLPLCS